MSTPGDKAELAAAAGDGVPLAVPVATQHVTGVADIVQKLNDPNLKGLVVRQESQFSEALAGFAGVPYNAKNGYAIMALPADKTVKRDPGGPGWSPSAEELVSLEQILFAREDNTLAMRAFYQMIGAGNLRSLKMNFFVNDGGEAFILDRPFKCGGICCCPLEMSLFRSYQPLDNGTINVGPQILIGRVKEDWDNYCAKYCAASCLLANTHKIQRAKQGADGALEYETAYYLVANRSCCAGPNNCCAPTCIRSDAVFNIYDAKTDEVVGRIQKSFGGKGDCCGAYLRLVYGFDNYVIEFPEDATSAEDRMLILTSVIQLDFQLFENSSNNNN